MPLLTNSAYRPALPFCNGHVQTIYPALFRRLPLLPFRSERIATPDGDFIDLNWLEHGAPLESDRCDASENIKESTGTLSQKMAAQVNAAAVAPPAAKGTLSQKSIVLPNSTHRQPLAILTHGLEGSAEQIYMRGMARALFASGWDVLAWNFRGCSGEPNIRLRSYHSGATDDLATVIAHASQRRSALVGFSLGGNIVLKYLGERAVAAEPDAPAKHANIIGAVAISVPCDLAGSTTVLERRSNRIYMERFLKTLRHKIREKHQRFPNALNIQGLEKIRTFREFDDRYTAPIHGFRDAEHYWHACSCLRLIEHIAVPSLLLNAADDPFLSPDCFPADIAQAHPFLHLEMPRHGGHVGFVRHVTGGHYYSELRACAFLGEALSAAESQSRH